MPGSLIYFAPRPAAVQLPTSFAELLVDFSSGPIVVPVYVPVLTGTLTTVSPASFLSFVFTSTWRHVGPAVATNAAVNFRFLVDGVLQIGGTTDNKLTGRIGSVALTDRVAVAAGLHTIDVEVSKFGTPLNSIIIDVVALPDLNNCRLSMAEQP